MLSLVKTAITRSVLDVCLAHKLSRDEEVRSENVEDIEINDIVSNDMDLSDEKEDEKVNDPVQALPTKVAKMCAVFKDIGCHSESKCPLTVI